MDLGEMSDRLEIAAALTSYTRAIDGGDWDRLDTVFTPDAWLDYRGAPGGTEGDYPTMKAWLAEVLPAFFRGGMHTLGQIDIVFAPLEPGQPRTASVVAYFDNPMHLDDGAGGTRLVEFGGLYHHEFVMTGDGWRSRALREEMVWQRGI